MNIVLNDIQLSNMYTSHNKYYSDDSKMNINFVYENTTCL